MAMKTIISAGLAFGLLVGCGSPDVILSGERFAIRAAAEAVENQALPIALPSPQANADWTHRGGSPTHNIGHTVLGASLTEVFSVNIGAGNARRARITADPVIAGGRIFAMDAHSQVTAVSAAGEVLWAHELLAATDNRRDTSGGGLATNGDLVFATTGFGALVALDAATGEEFWRQDLDAPGGSAPAVVGDLVYVVGRDSQAWAIEAASGRVRWTLGGIPSESNFSGGAGPAVSSELAVFPMPTGEIVGAFPQGGLRRWATVISGQRQGSAAATVSDISGDPVLVDGRIYVGNISGSAVALDAANGARIWTATEGAVSPMLPVGGSVFLLNDLNQLVRLDASDGSPIWRIDLSGFEENRTRRQKTRFAHYGPILAGGRLVVASSDGLIRQYDPVSGALVGQVEIASGAASNPVVAGGTLYVVSKRGQLVAFR